MTWRAAIAGILVSLTAHTAPQVDWLFPMGAQRGTEALAQIGGKHSWPLKAWTDDPGIAITADANKTGHFKIKIAKGVVPGPHLIRFHDANGTTPPRVFFVGKATDVREKEPNNQFLDAQKIDALPAILHGKLQTGGDVDAYRVSLKAGQVFVASLEAYTAGVPMDALMMLRDSRGVKLAFNHDAHSLDPRLHWKCDRDGEYVLQVAAFKFPANSTSSFTGGANLVYRLTLTNGPWLRHAWPAAVNGGTKSRVGLVGWNLKNDSVTAPITKDGELVLPVTAVNGPLRLPVLPRAEVTEREPNDTNATANEFGLPMSVSARIDRPGDVDRFAFTAKKGERCRIDLDSFSLGFILDAHLAIEDAAGKQLTTNDDANKQRDPLLNWTAPADGRYCVKVRSLLGKGGADFFYRLQLSRPAPSFHATVPTPQFTLNAGATNEVKVTVNYRDSYKGKLIVRTEGLPKGVTTAPVEIEKQGTATLKLIAAKDAQPQAGPLRVIVGPMGKSAKAATTSLTSAGTANGVPQGFPDYIIRETPHLWLTVLPPKPPEKKPAAKKN